ncbi:MAG TPA: hypothetical protein VFW21_10870 [Mycobacterium sp.]|nr:hypothetical protein [Mycobacterium sp.]
MTGPTITNRAENVVYSVAPECCPSIRYRSIPSECGGAATTLAEARSSYRAQLLDRLHVSKDGLPPVTEHLEAVVRGMWVREEIGTVHRDRYADRMFLQTLLAPGCAQSRLRAHVEQAAQCGAQPVVVLVEADEPIAAVLDQMTAHDAVVVAYSDPEDAVGWAAMYGIDSVGAREVSQDWQMPSGEDLRRMPVESFVRGCPSGQSVRVPAEALASLPDAC